MHRRSGNSGVTLIELMVTLVILTILMFMAAPSFRNYLANQNVKGTTHRLIAVLRYARSEAVNRNRNITVEAADGGWAAGWQVVDDNPPSPRAVLMNSQNADPRWTIDEANGADSVTFSRTGRPVAGVSFSVCDVDQSPQVKRRVVGVSSTGMPVIEIQGDCGNDD